MITNDRVKVTPRRRGRPKKSERFAQTVAAALAYEHHPGNSEQAFEDIASALCTSTQTVRQAVTAMRKSNNASRKANDK